MTVAELIARLEEYRRELGPDMPVGVVGDSFLNGKCNVVAGLWDVDVDNAFPIGKNFLCVAGYGERGVVMLFANTINPQM